MLKESKSKKKGLKLAAKWFPCCEETRMRLVACVRPFGAPVVRFAPAFLDPRPCDSISVNSKGAAVVSGPGAAPFPDVWPNQDAR